MYDFCFVCTVFNREQDIERFVDSMLDQTYPSEKFIVVIVDNGSTDNTISLLENYRSIKNIKLIDGSDVKGSPYSARNLVLKNIQAENYCFMDGYVCRNYLENASELVLKDKMVAGKIEIETDNNSSPYEIYDSIFNLDVEKIINKYQRAPTGNLIVNKRVIESLGFFNESIRSGGDMIYTSKAVDKGFSLIFCNHLVSQYHARNKKELLIKQRRISRGQVGIWKSENKVFVYLVKSIAKFFIPNNPARVFTYIKSRSNNKLSNTKLLHLYFINERMKFIMSYNNLKEFIKSL